MKNKHCGFVTLVGSTNSGKSTLLNSLLGQKVSIVSPKPQTTYHRIKGIVTREQYQIIFLDTPGFQNFSQSIPKILNRVALEGAVGADVLLWVLDVSSPSWKSHLEHLRKTLKKEKETSVSICVLNKIDKVSKLSLLPEIQWLTEIGDFKEVVPISALRKDGIERLETTIAKYLPEAEFEFAEDVVTDRSTAFLITEMIREQVYLKGNEEIPYSVLVELERWQPHPNPAVQCPTLWINILITTPSKKKILIGKKGSLLKEIGTRARQNIESMLGHQVCLKLFIKVKDDWQKDKVFLNQFLEMDGPKHV